MDVRERRKELRTHSTKMTTVKKGAKGINTSTRTCTVCCRSLAKCDSKGKPFVTVTHYRIVLSPFLCAYMCKDIRSCRRTIKEREQNASR